MLAGKIKKQSDRTLWISIRPGFEVQVRHITRHELREMHAAAQEDKFDVHEQVMRRVRSEELFAEELAKRLKGWRGLTGATLRLLVEMPEEEYPADDEEIPFSVEDAKELFLHSLDFQVKLEQVIYDLSVFEQARRASLKNVLSPSLNGN